MANLSKVQIGGIKYDLKDAAVRDILKLTTFGDITGVLNAVGADADKLITSGAVKNYVDAAVQTIHNFDVVIYSSLPTASEDTMYILGLVQDPQAPGTYIEYITIRTGTDPNYTYRWEQIGSTSVDLTGYLEIESTVAGVEFGADKAITKAELETALELGDFAHADTGTVTPSGTIAEIDATPAGSVTGTVVATGSVAGTVTPSGSVSVSATKNNTDGAFQVSGTINTPTITVTPAAGTIYEITGVGTLPTYTDGSYTAPSVNEATSAFATEGVMAEVGTGDDSETLIITSATTGNALTSTGFNAGSYTAPTYVAGTLPTREEASVVTGITSATSSELTFTGDKFDISGDFTGDTNNITATFTGTSANIDATFTGTQNRVTPVFTGQASTVTPVVPTP